MGVRRAQDRGVQGPRPHGQVIAEAAAAAGTGSASSSNQPQAATSTGARISPYYLNIRLPGQKDEHFIVIVPFVPATAPPAFVTLTLKTSFDSFVVSPTTRTVTVADVCPAAKVTEKVAFW